ncbi:DNA-directed RNA polymerase subunit beta' [Bacillus bombysepticus]|uniref:DNA-directed RNA polymerase subunit beta' n=1 Tax=Bacillus bombysepticus TaxID=658666 RepID=UPI0030179240
MGVLDELKNISIMLGSPEKIKGWSFGEVKKPETINHRTHNPERDGLFCEVIFGPVKDYQCASSCGKYKRSKERNVVCDRCGVKVTKADVRRSRMGHIELGTPVVHHWFLKTKPYYITALLDIPKNNLNLITYTEMFVVKEPGIMPFEKKELIPRKQYEQARREEKRLVEEMVQQSKEDGVEFDMDSIPRFRAGTGGEIIREMLEEIDLDVLVAEISTALEDGPKEDERKKLEKRLRIAEMFRRSGNRPEWMVLTVLPVMPPDLRPMVQLDGGRFAASDVNDLYRKVINRNNRYKRLVELGSPSIIVDNEARLVQEAVDALFNNAKVKKPVEAQNKRRLKSISDALEKKSGIFRQNLLGKRVDYSGRSVIIPGPTLKLHQCGLPRLMAIELFKPFVMKRMVDLKLAPTIRSAGKKIDNRSSDIWEVLEEVVQGHPVLLNRAPTLHKLSIRAFEVVLIEGKAIQLHPLVCSGYNADFDGDQMAVHVPISKAAIAEAQILMRADRLLLHPQNGGSAVTPSQDMVLGTYYLTMEQNGLKGEGIAFANEEEAIRAYEDERVGLHTRIILNVRENPKFNNSKYVVTTVGKIIFNTIVPEEVVYFNDAVIQEGEPVGACLNIKDAVEFLKTETKTKAFSKGFVKKVIDHVYNISEQERVSKMMDDLKEIGFKYATIGGLTINLFDIRTSDEKEDEIDKAKKHVDNINGLYQMGQITDDERYIAVIKYWEKLTNIIAKQAIAELEKDPLNSIWMMLDSGARGSDKQYRQLAAMRGSMANPNGHIIENPVVSNYLEGLNVHEFFSSTHGTRKGLADTAIKTASSGYLTRRMADVAQHVIISEEDCHSDDFMVVKALEPRIESLYQRILGRYTAKDVIAENGELIVKKDTFISEKIAQQIENSVSEVPIRTVITCASTDGVCKKCYGMNLSTRRLVEVGEAIGIVAAQSIGEPGTQLTMRTFHTGGIASSGGDITQGLPRIVDIFEARKLDGAKQTKAILSQVDGVVEVQEKSRLKEVWVKTVDGESHKYNIPLNSSLAVKNGDFVDVGKPLTTAPINPHDLLSLKGTRATQEYLLEEVQKVYAKQGVEISDKHIETIVRQMFRKVIVRNVGDASELIKGQEIDRYELQKRNAELEQNNKEVVEYVEIINGITEASLEAESFLSRSSFQETSKGLTSASVAGSVDEIVGLKESVITGKLIPAGSGFKDYLELRN